MQLWLTVLQVTLWFVLGSGFKVCHRSKKTPNKEGREHFALVPVSNDTNATAAAQFYAFGGEFKGDARDVDLFEWAHYSLSTDAVDLPESQFNPSSVRRVANDLYLAVPSVTDDSFFFWNAENDSVVVGDFPVNGLRDYCLVFSVSRRMAVITGGKLADDSVSAAWFTLDLSDSSPSALVSAKWTQHSSDLPFKTFSHSCCVLGGFPMVFGGFNSDSDNKPMKNPFKLDWDTMSWSQVTKQRVNKGLQCKLTFRANAVCVSESIDFLAKDELIRAYLVGGRDNNSKVGSGDVTRLQWNAELNRVEYSCGRKNPTTAFWMKRGHISGAAVMLRGKIYLMGGLNKKKKAGKRIERLDVACQKRRLHKVRSPLKDAFCIPYYILYPLGLICSLFWFGIRSRIRDYFDNNNSLDLYWKQPYEWTQPFTSAKAPTWGTSIELTTLNPIDTALRLQMCQLYEDAIVHTLTADRRLPQEISQIVYGYCGPLEMEQVEYGREFRERLSLCCVCRRLAQLCCDCVANTYNCGCHLCEKSVDRFCAPFCVLHAALKIGLHLASFLILMWYYVEFVIEFKSIWQESFGLWLVAFSHPAIKWIADAQLKHCDPEKYDVYIYVICAGLLLFWACASSPVFLPGVFVFPPYLIVGGALAYGIHSVVFDDTVDNAQKRMTATLLWLLFAATVRATCVTFAVWMTRVSWPKAFAYGMAGADCPNFQFDASDFRAWILLLSWVL